MTKHTGQCMCGAVTVEAEIAKPGLTACHCDMCRRWSSGAFVAITTVPGSVVAKGPFRVVQTSEWAERAFCTECGSPLWYRVTIEMPNEDNSHQLAAGLFDNAAGLPLKLEVFIDKKPEGYAFEGGDNRRQMTEAEVFAIYGPEADESE